MSITIFRKRNQITGEVTVTYIKGNFEYVGDVLTPQNLISLKQTGRTVMRKSTYDALPHEELEKECSRLAGFECSIDVIEHPHEVAEFVSDPTIKVYKTPHYYIIKDGVDYKLFNFKEEVGQLSIEVIDKLKKAGVDTDLFKMNSKESMNAKRLLADKYHIDMSRHEIKNYEW